MGVVAPRDGFNAELAEIAHRHGALLIVDEVMTGFRVSPRRLVGARPGAADLYTFGKVMGGGLPAAAFGGRTEIMSRLAPAGPVYQAGTLSGNPLACAAGLATLRLATADVYARLDETSSTIQGLAAEALTKEGVPHRVSTAGNMFSVFFTDRDVANYDDAKTQNVAAYKAFFHAMLAGGVYLPPSAYEAWFVLDRDRRRGAGSHRRRSCRSPPAPRRRQRGRSVTEPTTIVHMLRHGEVYNPEKVLYGRLPGYRLSELGVQMAKAAAESLAGHDVTYLVASPLERAQQTAEPFAAEFELPIAVDDRLIESANVFEGKRVSVGDGALRDPRNWWALRNPITPSWGEPYQQIALRMYAALEAARERAEGHEAVCVSHQLPIWMLRCYAERRRLFHDPRRRQARWPASRRSTSPARRSPESGTPSRPPT